MSADWATTNRRIGACKRSPDPLACLGRLFDETTDGFVALNAGQVAEERGKLHEALRWHEQAEALLPMEKWKRQARESAERVRALLNEGADVAPTVIRLVVVGCTKRKVWHDDRSAPEFVPARHAYTGSSLPTWVRAGQDEPSGAAWLFLSAKYGFIEPDHPIGNYDVTFSDSGTGPITPDALRQQVEHQTRFGDWRLRDVTEVRVLAGAKYREAVEYAFAGLATRVLNEAGPPSAPPREAHVTPGSFSVVPERAEALGRALAELSPTTFDSIDQGEPEWPVLSAIRQLPDECSTLTAILLGLCDYQLGPGGASLYWQGAHRELRASPPSDTTGTRALLERILGHPVSSRENERKLARVDRLLESDLPAWLADRGPDGVGDDLVTCWRKLAAAMRNPLEAKTIVFAVKLVDLMHFQRTGRRAGLPDGLPIAVDIRIARASVSSGILRSTAATPADELLGLPSEDLLAARDPHVAAWALVAAQTEHSPLRLDSLVWQAAGHIRPGVLKERSQSSIAGLLVGYGASPGTANRVAEQLTDALRPHDLPVS